MKWFSKDNNFNENVFKDKVKNNVNRNKNIRNNFKCIEIKYFGLGLKDNSLK